MSEAPSGPPPDARMRALLDEHTDYLAVVDASGTVVYANQAVTRLFGWQVDEVLGKVTFELIHPDDRDRIMRTLGETMATPGAQVASDYRLRCKDGSYRMVESRGVNLLHVPEVRGIVATTRDVTDQRRTQEEVSKQRQDIDRQLTFARTLQRMSEVIASSDDPTLMLTALVRTIGESLKLDRCVIFDVDRRRSIAGAMSEYLNPENTEATSVLRDFPLELFPRTNELLWTRREALHSDAENPAPSLAEEGSHALIHRELKVRSLIWLPFSFRPDGYFLLALNQVSRRRDWRPDEVVFVHSAATHVGLALQKRHILGERLQAEEQLRQSQKMEAIGRLAGGIAHDFNNLLTAIIGYADLIHARLPEGDPLRHYVDGILQVANRAAGTTHQLLSFSRRQVLTPKILELNTLVAQLDGLLRRLIGENIQLEVTLGAHAGRVRADPGQLELALVNLAVNARDAMPRGGRLLIQTSACQVDPPLSTRLNLPAGTYARVVVHDSGMGMEPEILNHLFEPFFTTKELGKGTGLGLSSVYGILRAAGGGVDVDSSPGRGSTFTVYLPSEGSPETAPPVDKGQMPARGGNERILLVEDDDILREMIGDALRARGYRVLAAANGHEALEICQGEPAIDLVLSDVVMPKLNGPSLARALGSTHPKARLLFMSGYTADAFQESPDLAQVPVLSKPFAIDQLIRSVRAVIDGPTARTPPEPGPPRS